MQALEFDKWLDLMKENVSRKVAEIFQCEPMNQPVDTIIARMDYDEGKTPEESADLFVKDWYD